MKFLLLLLLLSVAFGAPAQKLSHVDSLMLNAQTLSRQKNYPAAIQAYQRVVGERTASPRYKAASLYNIACYYGLLHDAPNALANLRQAIEAGYVNAAHIAVDSDLELLHADKQWPKLLARARQLEEKTIIRRPEDAKLVTTDIDHFWKAYAAVQRDTTHAAAIFRRDYFAKASAGLQDYYKLKIESDQDFARTILARPRYYNSIRTTTRGIAAEKPKIVAAFRRFQELYPAVRFQHIYFVVGG